MADVDILQLSNPVGPLADLEDNLEQPRAFLNTGMHPESGFPLPPTTLQASTPYPRVQGCLTPPLHLALLLLGPCLCSQRGGTNLLFQPTGSMLALPMKVSSLTGRSTRNHCLQSQCWLYRCEALLPGTRWFRFDELPKTITYCFSVFKVADMIEQAPAATDLHPSVHTLIVHLGASSGMRRRSAKLQFEFEPWKVFCLLQLSPRGRALNILVAI